MPLAPSTLLKTGKFAKNISAIIGFNENDGALFTASPADLTNATALHTYLAQYFNLSDAQVAEALELYPANSSTIATGSALYPDIPIEWWISSQIWRDSGFTCPGLLMAQSMASYSDGAEIYLYDLNSTLFAPFLAADNGSYNGVIHFGDIPYVFNQAAGYKASDEQIALAGQISASWAEFAYSGSPVGKNGTLQDWPAAFTPGKACGSEETFVIEVIGGPTPGPVQAGATLDPAQDFEEIGRRCAFWNRADILAAFGV